MVRLLLVALALSFTASAAEVPLAPSDIGPSPRTILGAVPHGDGFFVVSHLYSGGKSHYFGTRISAAGEVLDPGGVRLLTTKHETHRLFDLREENGRTLLVVTTGFPEVANNWEKLDYRIERMTLDVDGMRIAGVETTVVPDWPLKAVRNAKGESLAFTYNNGHPTLWFVGADGVRRKPTLLTEPGPIVSFVPYGDGEWLLLGNRERGTVWHRISEPNRAIPQTRLVEYATMTSSEWKQHIASADGQYAVLTEDVSQATNSYQRVLTLRVILPDGSSVRHTLIDKENLGSPRFTPAYPSTASLAKDGEAWLVAYSWWDATGQQQLRLWRVTDRATETKLDSMQQFRPPGAYAPHLISGATSNLLLFLKPRDGSGLTYDRYAWAWDRGTTPAPAQTPRLFAAGLPVQTTPSAVAGPDGLLAVWREGDAPAPAMLRVLDGKWAGSAPLRLSSPLFDAQSPVIARNGNTFAAAWVEVRHDQWHVENLQRIVVQRFDGRGTPLDAEPLVIVSTPSLPDTSRVAIGADADGFRLAWHGRSLQNLSTHVKASQTVYTTRIGASGNQFPTPVELAPPYLIASAPVIVSHGADSLVLWKEGNDEIHGRRYTNGAPARPGNTMVTRGVTFAATAGEGELLIATVRTGQERICTDAQRFSFDGVALAPAASVACVEGYPTQATQPSTAWDAGRWWVAPSTPAFTHVHELTADGTPSAAYRYFADDTNPFLVSLVATGTRPSAVYIRADATAQMAQRAFLRTFPWPRSRAVRH